MTMTTGSWRWNAPELFLNAVRNLRTDVYAFGCVCLEASIFYQTFMYAIKLTVSKAYTRQYPFADISFDHQVIYAVSKGRRLSRPSERDHRAAKDDPIWDLAESCWDPSPEKRPSSKQLSEDMVTVFRHSLSESDMGIAINSDSKNQQNEKGSTEARVMTLG
jgi:serine/threonine protein kinase